VVSDAGCEAVLQLRMLVARKGRRAKPAQHPAKIIRPSASPVGSKWHAPPLPCAMAMAVANGSKWHAPPLACAGGIQPSQWALVFGMLGVHTCLPLEQVERTLTERQWQEGGWAVRARAASAAAGAGVGPGGMLEQLQGQQHASTAVAAVAAAAAAAAVEAAAARGAAAADASTLAADGTDRSGAEESAAAAAGEGAVYHVHDVACPEFEALCASILSSGVRASSSTTTASNTTAASTSTHPSSSGGGSGSASGCGRLHSPLAQLTRLAHLMEQQWRTAGYADALTATVACSSTTTTTGNNLHAGMAEAAAGTAVLAVDGDQEGGGEGVLGGGGGFAAEAGASGGAGAALQQLLLPSSFAVALSTTPWLVSSRDTPARPTELYLGPAYKPLLGSKVRIGCLLVVAVVLTARCAVAACWR